MPVGKWLDMARKEETPPSADSAVSADSSVSRPIDTKDTNGTLRFSPAQRLREWHSKLEPLACLPAPECLERERWCELVGDAWWIYERFGSQLVRQGWSALDIFGIVPGETHLGGIIARLYGSRNLKLESIQAVWSCNGRRDWACVGGADCLGVKGVRALWDLRR